MISISHNAIEELTRSIEELETLTSKPAMTSKDEKRHAFLLSKVSLLKSGISVSELRRYESDRLLAQAGLARAPHGARTKLDAETAQEWRSFMLGEPVRPTRIPSDVEVRANEAGTQSITATQGPAGGYFVPFGIHDRAFESMKQYDQVFDDQFCNPVEIQSGASTTFPSWDDVSNSSVQIGETVQSSELDIANFGNITLNAYSFRSKIVAVSLELLQDSQFDWGLILERVFAMRHARGVGQALISGSGSNAPTGLVTAIVASGASPTVAAGSATNTGGGETGSTSIGTQDINNLYKSLDPMYRKGAAYYMNDATLEYLQGLLDKMGRPIVSFRKGLDDIDGDCPYILGKKVAICPSMPTMASGHNSVVFGNPFYFCQRRVPSSTYVRRFSQNPTLVLNGLIGFESWMRVDSNLVAPNVNYLPYQFIQNHS